MRNCKFGAVILILLGSAAFNTASPSWDGGLEELYDIQGRFIGSVEGSGLAGQTDAVVLPAGAAVSIAGEYRDLPAGIYFKSPAAKRDIFQNAILDEFSFDDVTEDYLPLQEWDASAAQIGDLDGDGSEDIVFVRWSSTDIGDRDYRPRVWMQTPDGSFTDESDERMPAVSTPCYDLELFDADSDGDLDIFTAGFSAVYYIQAALFINDGTGHFADESAERLPAPVDSSIVYFCDHADFDGDGDIDIIVNLLRFPEAPDYEQFSAVLWMNYYSGRFIADTLGRLPANPGYGYFMPLASDIDGDDNIDIIFADMEYTIYDENGNPVAVFSGQNASFRNTGGGLFVDETDERMPPPDCENTRDITASDVDGDGDFDLAEIGFYFGDYNEQNRIILNDGGGYFSVLPNGFPDGLEGWFNDAEFGMLNDDIYPDLFMVKVMPGMPDYDVLLVNDGDGTMSDSSSLLPMVLDFGTSSALFDHQHDEDLDIFSTNTGSGNPFDTVGQNVLYHNLLHETTEVDGPGNGLPASFGLSQSYPNPFNAATAIRYSLPEQGDVAISIYNLLGQRVATVLEGIQEAGEHTVTWDASYFPSGVYFARLETCEQYRNIKMILLK